MPVVLAVLLGLAGWVLFDALEAPVAALCGPAVVVAIAALSGVPLRFPKMAQTPVLIALGIVLGDAADPRLVGALGVWPASLIAMGIAMTVIVIVVSRYLKRFGKLDRPTAFFAAIPGALSLSLVLAEAAGARMAPVAIIQTIRLLILVAILPPLIAITDPSVIGAGFNPDQAAPMSLLLTIGAGLLGVAVAHGLRLPAASFIGAMLGAGLASGSGLATGNLPVPAANTAMLALGIMTGTRFAAVALGELLASLKLSLGAFILGGIIAASAAAVMAPILGLPLGQVLLAFAPGGLETMTVLALVMGFDPVYVALHHMVRMFALSLILPWIGRFPRLAEPDRKTEDRSTRHRDP